MRCAFSAFCFYCWLRRAAQRTLPVFRWPGRHHHRCRRNSTRTEPGSVSEAARGCRHALEYFWDTRSFCCDCAWPYLSSGKPTAVDSCRRRVGGGAVLTVLPDTYCIGAVLFDHPRDRCGPTSCAANGAFGRSGRDCASDFLSVRPEIGNGVLGFLRRRAWGSMKPSVVGENADKLGRTVASAFESAPNQVASVAANWSTASVGIESGIAEGGLLAVEA